MTNSYFFAIDFSKSRERVKVDSEDRFNGDLGNVEESFTIDNSNFGNNIINDKEAHIISSGPRIRN